MKNTLVMFMDSEGVGADRQLKVLDYIKSKPKMKISDWLIHQDGIIGMTWQKMCSQVGYDLERLNIDDTAMVSLNQNGRKHYTLPTGFSGERLAKWIDHNTEIIDYWVSLVAMADKKSSKKEQARVLKIQALKDELKGLEA